ncbi:MAG TPA: hypothetical protein VID47_06745 [Actinomycetota bacterium]|jgi:integrase
MGGTGTLGHASISTTANVYRHDDNEAGEVAALALGQVLDGSG